MLDLCRDPPRVLFHSVSLSSLRQAPPQAWAFPDEEAEAERAKQLARSHNQEVARAGI